MKVCMIGSRGHVFYAFESLRETGLELAAVSSGCGDSPDKLVTMAEKRGFSPKVYGEDYREMLDKEKPDIVCIDGPFECHAEMCMEALRRHIHVFCEKPIALSLQDLAEIEAVWQTSGAKIMSMVGLRYDPAFLFAHKLVEQGAIGKVKLIQTQKSYKLGQRPDFYRHRESYGGTIPWVGSHALDWILYFGGGDFSSVWAVQSRSDNHEHGDLEVVGQCQFQMTNGVIAQASIDYLRPEAASTHGDDRVRIAGTRGILEVRGGEVILLDAQGEETLDVPPADRRIFEDFVLDVQGIRPALTDSKETFRLTRGCLLAQQAADRDSLGL